MAGSETSKEAVRKALSGDKATTPLPFMPWVCTHAAKLEQVPLRNMLNDPSLLTRALENAQRLYGYDMVANIFDTTIEAEACGCPVKWTSDKELPVPENHQPINNLSESDISSVTQRGRLPVVIEATKRLKTTLGRTVAIAGVVTGPFTLAGHLRGEDIADALERDPATSERMVEIAGKVCLEVCKSYCEFEVDAIVISESVMPRLPERFFPLAVSILGPLFNVIRFYNSLSLLLVRSCTRESLGLLTNMDADAVVVDGGIEADLRDGGSRCIVGQSIPSSVLEGPKEQLKAHIDKCLKGDPAGVFISTEWQVPYDTPPENIHQLIRHIRE